MPKTKMATISVVCQVKLCSLSWCREILLQDNHIIAEHFIITIIIIIIITIIIIIIIVVISIAPYLTDKGGSTCFRRSTRNAALKPQK